MHKLLVITIKGDHKYQFGTDKSVAEVLHEIKKTRGDFYVIYDACAIRKNEIVSIEQFEYDSKAEGESNND